MEFSSLELIKQNSENALKKPHFEEDVPLVPFTDFLRPTVPDVRPSETPARAERKSDRPEPAGRASEDPRTEPIHRQEAKAKPEAERENAEGKAAETPASTASDSTVSDSDRKDATETARSLDGKANLERANANGEGLKPNLSGLEAVTDPTALNLRPSTEPLLAALKGIEAKATGKDGTPPPAANVLRNILEKEFRANRHTTPTVDPRLSQPDNALEKNASTKRLAGFSLANGENTNNLFPLPSGQAANATQTINTTQANSFGQVLNATTVTPLVDLQPQALQAFTAANVATAPTGEAPIGGLSALNVAETATARATTFSAMNGRAPTSPSTPPLTDQVAIQLKQAVNEGLDRIRIQLKPAALGHIDITMEIAKDGKVMAVISAERPETFELLQRDARALERALQEAGLRADSNSLNFQMHGHGDNQTGENTHDGGVWKEEGVEGAETSPSKEDGYWTVSDGLVDIRV
ncbi:MAG: hypothetical protein COA65_07250 [Rhodospirillaceae bacterium]|nr:MAG: hypothetical protein COA65_07250 [Rhodospirillaceae bacterium]